MAYPERRERQLRQPSREPVKEAEREKRKLSVTLSLRQLVMYGSGIVLALAWMFVFGVLVGREAPLVDSREISIKAHVMRFLGLGRQPPPPPEQAAMSWDPPEKMLESLNYHQNLLEGAGASLDVPNPEEHRDKKKAASKQEAAPEAGLERYTLLVSSVRNKEGAQRLVDQLKAKGYASRLETMEKPETGRWNRVLVGTFDSREKAVKFATEFNQREHMEGLVVRQGP